MINDVYVKISAYNFEKLCKLHDEWRKAKGSVMAEQDINFMISRLIQLAEKK